MSEFSKRRITAGAGVNRRVFLAAGGAAVGLGITGFPAVLRAEPKSVKIGLIHPVTGAISFSGTQCRAGAQLAIADINAAGGIKSLGGAKIEGVLGRPATNRQDIKLTLVEREPGRYEVQAGNIAAGSWLIALEAREGAGADPIYRTRRRLWIKP